MTKDFCERMFVKYVEKTFGQLDSVCENIRNSDTLKQCDKDFLIYRLKNYYNIFDDNCSDLTNFARLIEQIEIVNGFQENCDDNDDLEIDVECEALKKKYGIDLLEIFHRNIGFSKVLKDSPWKFFYGDLIITDPCYIKHFDYKDFNLCHDTMTGDCRYVLLDKTNKTQLGHFCSDSGMACVEYLNEIMRHDPYCLERIEEHSRVIIRDFSGDVRYRIICKRKNKYELLIEGMGRNYNTGRKIDFITEQTIF